MMQNGTGGILLGCQLPQLDAPRGESDRKCLPAPDTGRGPAGRDGPDMADFWSRATRYAAASGDKSFVREVAYMMVTLHRTGA